MSAVPFIFRLLFRDVLRLAGIRYRLDRAERLLEAGRGLEAGRVLATVKCDVDRAVERLYAL